MGLNAQNKTVSVSESDIYFKPSNLKKAYLIDIHSIEVTKRLNSLFIQVHIDRMVEQTLSLSNDERFTITVEPLPNPSYSQYELVELEVLAIRKKFPQTLMMVDEAMLPFPASVSVFSERNFGQYFQESTPLEIELKHSSKHFGYAIRLKYAEKTN